MKLRTRMTRKKGLKLARAAIIGHTATVERVGFRRSDERHPGHPRHLELFHVDGMCNCVGVGHPREALKAA